MQPLTGLGIWIWELPACERGDLDAIAAKALRAGVSWLAIKAGDSRSNGQVTRAVVERLRSAGLECAAWWYSVPGTSDLQVAQLLDLVDRAGVDHFIQDAELEWEKGGDHRAEAALLANRIRVAIGDAYLADAPWPIVRAHPTFPFVEFGMVADARMPQAYYAVAELDGGEPATRYLDDGDRAWAASSLPVCPIVSNVNATGAKRMSVGSLANALDRYQARETYSIWSWQHLSALEWALLEQRARAARTFVEPPDPPQSKDPA